MKNLLLTTALLLVSFTASAEVWNVYPTKGDPAVAASQASNNVGIYVVSIVGMEQGKKGLTRYNIAAAERAVRAGMQTCYSPNTDYTRVNVKPVAPVVCVEDVISLQSTVDSSPKVKAYANALSPQLTETSFAAKIDAITTE